MRVCVHINANREREDQDACGNTRSLSCGPVPVLLSLACLAAHVCVRFIAHQVHHQSVDLAHVMGIAVSSRAQVAALPPLGRLPLMACHLEKDVTDTDFSRHVGAGAPTARERPSKG